MQRVALQENGRAKWGSLRDCVLAAHKATKGGTPQQIAQLISSPIATVRATLNRLKLKHARTSEAKIIWTPEMKKALLKAVLENRTTEHMSEYIGVSRSALTRGLVIILREHYQ